MKHIKFNLSDGTPVKFKIRRLIPYGLDIEWKYTDRFNFSNYINLDIAQCWTNYEIEKLQQLSDAELINKYRNLIEKEHAKIKNTKRYIT